jgi:hypothetical protein
MKTFMVEVWVKDNEEFDTLYDAEVVDHEIRRALDATMMKLQRKGDVLLEREQIVHSRVYPDSQAAYVLQTTKDGRQVLHGPEFMGHVLLMRVRKLPETASAELITAAPPIPYSDAELAGLED